MKRIGKLNGKTVVQCDPNLVKQNEILYKQEPEGIILQERKQNNLENITAGGSSGSEGGFTYKSRKVVWRINKIATTTEHIFEVLAAAPFYSVAIWDSYDNRLDKAYGIAASGFIINALFNARNGKYFTIFLEECEGNFNVKIPNTQAEIETNGSFIDYYIKSMLAINPELEVPSNEEMIQGLESIGIVQVPYEDYMNLRLNQEFGCLTLTN